MPKGSACGSSLQHPPTPAPHVEGPCLARNKACPTEMALGYFTARNPLARHGAFLYCSGVPSCIDASVTCWSMPSLHHVVDAVLDRCWRPKIIRPVSQRSSVLLSAPKAAPQQRKVTQHTIVKPIKDGFTMPVSGAPDKAVSIDYSGSEAVM